jgi:hypothetical protein
MDRLNLKSSTIHEPLARLWSALFFSTEETGGRTGTVSFKLPSCLRIPKTTRIALVECKIGCLVDSLPEANRALDADVLMFCCAPLTGNCPISALLVSFRKDTAHVSITHIASPEATCQVEAVDVLVRDLRSLCGLDVSLHEEPVSNSTWGRRPVEDIAQCSASLLARLQTALPGASRVWDEAHIDRYATAAWREILGVASPGSAAVDAGLAEQSFGATILAAVRDSKRIIQARCSIPMSEELRLSSDAIERMSECRSRALTVKQTLARYWDAQSNLDHGYLLVHETVSDQRSIAQLLSKLKHHFPALKYTTAMLQNRFSAGAFSRAVQVHNCLPPSNGSLCACTSVLLRELSSQLYCVV